MSMYRYVSTSLLTGQVYADSLPLVVRSASRVINGAGRLDGYLPLQQSAAVNRAFVQALTPGKSVLWVLQDGWPVWGGIVWDDPHRSILDGQYPVTAWTIESLFTYRKITGYLPYTNTDLFSIVRGLFQYGTDSRLGPNAAVAGLTYQSGTAGATASAEFGMSATAAGTGTPPPMFYAPGADNQDVLAAATGFAAANNVEFTFEPTITPGGTYGWILRLGYPVIGQTAPTQTLTFPGTVIDYARPVLRSGGANHVIATASGNGTGAPYLSSTSHGIDTLDLASGMPLQQVAVSYPGAGVTSQAQVDQYADSLLPAYTHGTMVPTIVIGGGSQPLLRQVDLGDAISFAATSPIDPADPVTGAPGLQIQGRITGWTLTPPADQQPETATLTLGALVGQTVNGTVGQ